MEKKPVKVTWYTIHVPIFGWQKQHSDYLGIWQQVLVTHGPRDM